MFTTERIIAAVAILWTIIALVYQWISARGRGRVDYSVKRGDVMKGILYNFTYAMLPQHKETVRFHPMEFVIGMLMHIGVFVAIFKVLWLVVFPDFMGFSPDYIGRFLGISMLCGIFLFARRILSRNVRVMSNPEDYISILVTIGFIGSAMAYEFGFISDVTFLIYSAIVFFYLPLGKLRHALFFFIARADYGSRLGYRGTYPARSEGEVG